MIARSAFGALLFAGTCLAQQYIISTVAGGAPPFTPAFAASSSIGALRNIVIDSGNNAFFTSSNGVFKMALNGVLTQVAGNARPGYSGDGGPAAKAQLLSPIGLAIDTSGNIFIADSGNNRIREVSAGGLITTVAGSGVAGFVGDSGPAVSAQLSGPTGVAVDTAGNLYIADAGNNRVRKVSVAGVITTIAGDGTAAQLSATSIAIDTAGNLFVGDTANYRVRKITIDGVITTVAGSGSPGNTGDGANALSAQLSIFGQLAIDPLGNLFIADTGNSSIRKVASGTITTVAGNGRNGYSGDGVSAKIAALAFPSGVALDSFGELLIADTGNFRIRFIGTDNTISTIAGMARPSDSGDGGAALAAQLSAPEGVAVDPLGNLYIADTGNNRVREVLTNGAIAAAAGSGVQGYSGDGGQATNTQLSAPRGVGMSSVGDLFVADSGNNRVREVLFGTLSTVAGNGDPASGLSAASVAVDSSHNLFIGDPFNFRVRGVSPGGIVSIVAGNGTSGFSGDDGPAINAQLSAVAGVAADTSGNIYIADTGNQRIRKVSSGTITTVAGNGIAGFSGDGDAATKAQLKNPTGIAVDTAGNLYIADTGNNRVRMVSTTGTISTIAGNGGSLYSGDGGAGSNAMLSGPKGVAVGKNGIVYVADTGNNAVRLLTPVPQSVIVSSVIDAASESSTAMTPGKIAVIYGTGLGPAQLVVNSPVNGVFGPQLDGTTVSFRGVTAPIYYTSATQVAVIVPYEVSGSASVPVLVSYQGALSAPFNVSFAAAAPGIFTANATGAGQAAAINVTDGTLNSASNPVKAGDYISIYATGEGLTSPGSSDGRLAPLAEPLPRPLQKVTATVGGVAATIAYAGAVPGTVEGLMQVNIQIPPLLDPGNPPIAGLTPTAITPGGRVPVVLTVGAASTVTGAVWISVASK